MSAAKAVRSNAQIGMASLLKNRLLAALSTSDRLLLQPSLEVVDLEFGTVIESANARILHVYFPTTGLASVVGTTTPHERIEVGMVGFEGMTGLAVVLGHDRSTNETVIQANATTLRMPSTHLRRAMRSSPGLRAVLLRYVHVFMTQASQTALANGRAKLNERLARWLLMWHDRLRTPHLTITHEFLALLLGVRRQGVTVALHELEGNGLIRGTRNQITIVDRDRLLLLAGGFYGVPEADYNRAIRKRTFNRRTGGELGPR
jgi:CRP-like cAMP-binding protein